MLLRVPPGGTCGWRTQGYVVSSDGATSTIDLSGVQWVEPAGLVTIAVMAQYHGERAPVSVAAPRDSNVANYLSRMGLGNVLDDLGVAHDLPTVRRHDVGGTLVELSPFDGTSGANAIAEHVFTALQAVDTDTARALHTAISEIGTNVPEHSGRPGGFLAAQMTHGNSKVNFAVGDAGTGLLAKLRSLGARDDLDAARLALKKHVTDTGVAHRGKGLAAVVRLVHRRGGSVFVVSGRGGLSIHSTSSSCTEFAYRLRGTVIQGIVPCRTAA